MLIESEKKLTLQFEHNKGVSLRQFLGNDQFIGLVEKTVELIGEQDAVTCICLLDKINEVNRAMSTLIDLQWN